MTKTKLTMVSVRKGGKRLTVFLQLPADKSPKVDVVRLFNIPSGVTFCPGG